MRNLETSELSFVSGGRGCGGAVGDRGASRGSSSSQGNGNLGTSTSNKNRARPESN